MSRSKKGEWQKCFNYSWTDRLGLARNSQPCSTFLDRSDENYAEMLLEGEGKWAINIKIQAASENVYDFHRLESKLPLHMLHAGFAFCSAVFSVFVSNPDPTYFIDLSPNDASRFHYRVESGGDGSRINVNNSILRRWKSQSLCEWFN